MKIVIGRRNIATQAMFPGVELERTLKRVLDADSEFDHKYGDVPMKR